MQKTKALDPRAEKLLDAWVRIKGDMSIPRKERGHIYRALYDASEDISRGRSPVGIRNLLKWVLTQEEYLDPVTLKDVRGILKTIKAAPETKDRRINKASRRSMQRRALKTKKAHRLAVDVKGKYDALDGPMEDLFQALSRLAAEYSARQMIAEMNEANKTKRFINQLDRVMSGVIRTARRTL